MSVKLSNGVQFKINNNAMMNRKRLIHSDRYGNRVYGLLNIVTLLE